jgi:Fe-S cluster assembly iron-binding protein IscA
MNIGITQEAARYVLDFLAKNNAAQPVRLVMEKTPGCGDAKFRFKPGACKDEDDTEHVAYGLTLLCNFHEFPELEGIHFSLTQKNAVPTLAISIPKMNACGCGAAYSPKPPTSET